MALHDVELPGEYRAASLCRQRQRQQQQGQRKGARARGRAGGGGLAAATFAAAAKAFDSSKKKKSRPFYVSQSSEQKNKWTATLTVKAHLYPLDAGYTHRFRVYEDLSVGVNLSPLAVLVMLVPAGEAEVVAVDGKHLPLQ